MWAGKPTTFVTITKRGKKRLVFAMPGNPVSAVVCTQLLVKPCLDLLYHGPGATTSALVVGDSLVSQIVENAWVHPEAQARLTHDVKLDLGRPEYHRVVLSESPGTPSSGTRYCATTTGVQRSSRLLSLRDANGLLLLPQATEEKTKAFAGERYPVLILKRALNAPEVRVRDSFHLRVKNGKNVGFQVAVIQVLPPDSSSMLRPAKFPSLESMSERIRLSLSGSKVGIADIALQTVYSGPSADLHSSILSSMHGNIDVIVVACMSYSGSYLKHLDTSSSLRRQMQKNAEVLAFRARQGAASRDPMAALFETVVGYIPPAMVVCLSDRGLDTGLGSIRDLLRHALQVGRDSQRSFRLDQRAGRGTESVY